MITGRVTMTLAAINTLQEGGIYSPSKVETPALKVILLDDQSNTEAYKYSFQAT